MARRFDIRVLTPPDPDGIVEPVAPVRGSVPFSTIVRPPRPSRGDEDIRRPTDRQRIMPDLGEDVSPYVEQAIRWLFDDVHETQRTLNALRKANLITKDQAEKLYSAAALKPKLQAQFPKTALNVNDLVGVLVQPQKAGVRAVTALPSITVAQDGELVFFNQIIYRFNGQTSVAPGQWEPILGQVRFTQTITGNVTIGDPNASVIVVPTGVRVRYVFTYDGSSGHIVSWNAVFKGISPLAVGRSANRVSIVEFDAISTSVFVRILAVGDVDVS